MLNQMILAFKLIESYHEMSLMEFKQISAKKLKFHGR